MGKSSDQRTDEEECYSCEHKWFPAEYVAEGGEGWLEDCACQEEGRSRPESLDGRAMQFLGDDGKGNRYRGSIKCNHECQNRQREESEVHSCRRLEFRKRGRFLL